MTVVAGWFGRFHDRLPGYLELSQPLQREVTLGAALNSKVWLVDCCRCQLLEGRVGGVRLHGMFSSLCQHRIAEALCTQ